MSQLRWMAAPILTKVLPFTSKGRSPEDEVTGGAGPPRVPVNFCTLVPLAATGEAATLVIWAIMAVAALAATVVVTLLQVLVGAAAAEPASHPAFAAAAVGSAAAPAAATAPWTPPPAMERPAKLISVALMTPVPVIVGLIPATADEISSTETSRTSSRSLKMQPGSSFSVSQELPLAVGSLTSPGAKVPLSRARRGAAPIAASCLASSSAIFLLVAAAPADAGSWCCEMAAI